MNRISDHYYYLPSSSSNIPSHFFLLFVHEKWQNNGNIHEFHKHIIQIFKCIVGCCYSFLFILNHFHTKTVFCFAKARKRLKNESFKIDNELFEQTIEKYALHTVGGRTNPKRDGEKQTDRKKKLMQMQF